MQISSKLTGRIALIISVVLLVGSFTQECYCTTQHCADSIAALLAGGLGFFFSWAGLTWLANPLLIASWITINKRSQLSLIFSLSATLLALSFLLFKGIMDNENGDLNDIISYQPGYWLWVASSLTMFTGNLIRFMEIVR